MGIEVLHKRQRGQVGTGSTDTYCAIVAVVAATANTSHPDNVLGVLRQVADGIRRGGNSAFRDPVGAVGAVFQFPGALRVARSPIHRDVVGIKLSHIHVGGDTSGHAVARHTEDDIITGVQNGTCGAGGGGDAIRSVVLIGVAGTSGESVVCPPGVTAGPGGVFVDHNQEQVAGSVIVERGAEVERVPTGHEGVRSVVHQRGIAGRQPS